MSTDDNNDDNNTTSKIDHTINFDPNARAIKPIEEHPLFHLTKEKGPSCDRQEDALTGIYKTTMDDESFFKKNISPCRTILGSWFREGSLGFIFGRRGAGKTWFAWDMAISISKGIKLWSLGVRKSV
jgi:hypothetical protein